MLKKKRACALFLLEPVGVRLALDFGLDDFILHLIEKDVLHLLVGEVLRQTVRRGGEDFLRGHVRGDSIPQNGENLRHQGSASVRTLRLGLGLGFVTGLARLRDLVANLGEDFHDFIGVSQHFGGVGHGGDSVVQSVNAGQSVLHSKSLSGL